MTGIFIQNISSPAEIVTNDVYGASFKVDILDQSDGTYLAQNISMQELIEPITTVSTTVVNNQVIGDAIIELTSVVNIAVTDRIKIGNYTYKIVSLIGNNITLNKGLYENISGGSTVTKQGNLGIYKVDLEIADLGIYTLIAKDSIFGLSSTNMIKVVPKSLETMYKDIKNLEYAILGN